MIEISPRYAVKYTEIRMRSRRLKLAASICQTDGDQVGNTSYGATSVQNLKSLDSIVPVQRFFWG